MALLLLVMIDVFIFEADLQADLEALLVEKIGFDIH